MLPSKQSRALQLMAGGFHLPTSSSSFPNSQLRVTTHPHLPEGRGVRLPLTILGAAATLGSAWQAGSKAGRNENPGKSLGRAPP